MLIDVMLGSLEQRYSFFWQDICLEKIKNTFEKIREYDLNRLLEVITIWSNKFEIDSSFTLNTFNYKHNDSKVYAGWQTYQHLEMIKIKGRSDYVEYASNFIKKHYTFLNEIIVCLDERIKSDFYQESVKDKENRLAFEQANTIVV